VVFAAKAGPDLNDPARRAAVEQSVAGLKYDFRRSLASAIVHDEVDLTSGRIALATAQFSVKASGCKTSSLDAVERAVEPARAAGVSVEYSGTVYPVPYKTSALPE